MTMILVRSQAKGNPFAGREFQSPAMPQKKLFT